jgi:phosphopantothenoylcysteine decarboxylase/phosphopantothenate--cysteine ligase
LKNKNIVLGVTASIAIYRACDLIRRLKEAGYTVTVIQTKESEELIKPVVFQSLSGNKVYCGLFNMPQVWEIEHVSLARQADLILIAPATANVIAKIASGICDDLLTCVVSATRAPILIAPAMNENMYKNKITQGNIVKLRGLGYIFINPKKGKLACGEFGIGCLADAEEIIKAIKNSVKQ